MIWKDRKSDYSRLVDLYKRRGAIIWKLHNEVLPEYLSKRAFQTGGKKLGISQQGTLVFDSENEVGVLMDYCLHEDRERGANAVQRYMADVRLDADSDEYAVVKAMSRSFHTVAQVMEVLPGVGVRAIDLFAGCEYLLVDMGFSKTAVKGIVIATRVYPYDDFVTTSGAPLPVDTKALREIRDSILPRYSPEQDGQCLLQDGRQKAADLTAAIIRVCLRKGAVQIEYERSTPRPALSPVRREPQIARNAPCPCGSGRKYKKCCGRTP
jgi:hypothetical protein